MNFNDFENIKKFIRKILSRENRKGLVVGVGILGMMLIGFSGFSGKSIKSVSSSKIDSKHTTELKREKLEKLKLFIQKKFQSNQTTILKLVAKNIVFALQGLLENVQQDAKFRGVMRLCLQLLV